MTEELTIFWDSFCLKEIPKCCINCKNLVKFEQEDGAKGVSCKKNVPIIEIGNAGTTGLLNKFLPIKKCGYKNKN